MGEHMKSIGIVDAISFLLKWKKTIAVISFSATVAAVVISLLLPKYFTSHSTIMPPQGGMGGFGLSGLSALKNLPIDITGGLAGSSLLSGNQSDRFMAILVSRSMLVSLIKKFDLENVYKLTNKKKKPLIEDVIQALKKNLSMESTDQGTIEIAITDKSPERASKMVNYTLCKLDSISHSIDKIQAGGKRQFLEDRLAETKKDLAAAEIKLLGYEDSNKVISIYDQAESSVKASAEFETRIIMQGIELTLLEGNMSEDNPAVQEKKKEISRLKSNLKKFSTSWDGEVLLPIRTIPQKALEYERINREIQIKGAVFKLLTTEYEKAKIDEKNTVMSFAVIDSGEVPEKRTRPKRSIMVIGTWLMSLLAAILFCLSIEAIGTLPEEVLRKIPGLLFIRRRFNT
jgi:tyrosine-protein kinase Etk/Wzc